MFRLLRIILVAFLLVSAACSGKTDKTELCATENGTNKVDSLQEDSVYRPFVAIIKDKDGYVNVRNENRQIVDKIVDNQIFSIPCADVVVNSSEYNSVEYSPLNISGNYGKNKDGNVHGSRILPLTKLPQLKKRLINEKELMVYGKDIEIRIIKDRGVPFASFKTDTLSNLHIGDKLVWGIDCANPEEQAKKIGYFKQITVKTKWGTFEFPRKELQLFYEPNFEYTWCAKNGNTLFLVMSNGDGAGAYALVWTIKDGKWVSTFVFRDF